MLQYTTIKHKPRRIVKTVSSIQSRVNSSVADTIDEEIENRVFRSPVATAKKDIQSEICDMIDDISFENRDYSFSPAELSRAKKLFQAREESESNVYFDLCNQDPINLKSTLFRCYNTPNFKQPENQLLPIKTDSRPTLVFDLDQTLWYVAPIASINKIAKQLLSDTKVICVSGKDMTLTLRPYAIQLISWASRYFEVVAFTAATSNFASKAFNYTGLDEYIPSTHLITRENCMNFKGNYVKCLDFLGRSAETTMMIDDTIIGLGPYLNQVYPVKPFCAEETDEELLVLLGFLMKALTSKESIVYELTNYTKIDLIAKEYVKLGNKLIGTCKNNYFAQFV